MQFSNEIGKNWLEPTKIHLLNFTSIIYDTNKVLFLSGTGSSFLTLYNQKIKLEDKFLIRVTNFFIQNIFNNQQVPLYYINYSDVLKKSGI